MLFGHQGEFDSQFAAINSIAPKIGCGPDTPGLGFCALRLTVVDVMA